jgi:hypothetical protein
MQNAKAEINRRQDEIAYWQAISSYSNRDEYRFYLSRYPRGLFADIAQNRINHSDEKGFMLDADGHRICQYHYQQIMRDQFSSAEATCRMSDGSWAPR